MARPRYETDETKKRERGVAALLKEYWAASCFKETPAYYPVDWYYHAPKIGNGLAEIKTRDHTFGTFPTYMISLHKVATGKMYADFVRKPFLLAVCWLDQLRVCDVADAQACCILGHGGRTDRDDPQDEEPMAYIPLEIFHPIDVDISAIWV